MKGEIYFIGILGSGMYPLARLLKKRGYNVAGSDNGAKCEYYTDDIGITISRGKNTLWENISLAVYSLAIDEGDDEILSARSLGIPLISRAQLLGALMSEYRTGISVSGSHGKSTVTALIDYIFKTAGIAHTTVSGATLYDGRGFTDGGGDVFVAEACEYKDSFLRLRPTYQIITAVELDHTDYFESLEDIRASFLRAASGSHFAIINIDDKVACEIANELSKQKGGEALTRIITYGRSPCADYRIVNVVYRGDKTEFGIAHGCSEVLFTTDLIGDFNLYNVAAAVALTDTLGVSQYDIQSAVSGFRAPERRLTEICRISDTPVYYDYAHHPSEISLVIDALRERYGKVTVIFRPHTYSRTRSLWSDFISALSKADFTILLDIYPAREKSIDGVNSKALAEQIKNCTYSTRADAVPLAISRPTDVIVLMGAGEVEDVKRALLRLGNNSE